jgi:flavin reductase (DIM6/NTAB) family NADH-FMN oxidoreductase RutF
MALSTTRVIDPQHFRRVLGQYPTGVCIVTGLDTDGQPLGMTVGSFTSVSLDPPLIAFLPLKGSRTFAIIAKTGRFAVNVLAGDQVALCRLFASREPDKFGSLQWHPSPLGSPILADAVAWIDCRLDTVHEAGDHLIVVGAVDSLEINRPGVPLLFFQGDYGRFSVLSLLSDAEDDGAAHLKLADLARPALCRLSSEFAVQAGASALVGDRVMRIAWAGAEDADVTATMVGLRLPFIAPFGLLFAAWAGDQVREVWLRQHEPDASGNANEVRRMFLDELARARSQGWTAIPDHPELRPIEASIARIASEGQLPEAIHELDRQIGEFAPHSIALADARPHGLAVPVFDHLGRVAIVLTLHGLSDMEPATIDKCRTDLIDAGRELTTAIRGVRPVSPD